MEMTGEANVKRVGTMVRPRALSTRDWTWRGEYRKNQLCRASARAWSWFNSRSHVLLLNSSNNT